ncbi:hypothetical protein NRY66_05655 [Acidithiobacillus ferrooxidans]|nr:hypothetical protein [Acidithiobacillus ferrooxidans]BDB14298.1 hypothetical protein ANFP_16180 [Acidithiobacillus ferrooxidans]
MGKIPTYYGGKGRFPSPVTEPRREADMLAKTFLEPFLEEEHVMYKGKFTASILLALGLMVPVLSQAEGTLLDLRNQAEDSPAALRQLQHQADSGNRTAGYYLGTLYDPGLKLGHIEKPDWVRATYWYQRSALAKRDPVTCYPNKAVAKTASGIGAWWRTEAEENMNGGDNDNGHC